VFASKKLHTVTALGFAVLLAACSKPAEKTADVRPVRAMVLAADNIGVDAEFAGEVRRASNRGSASASAARSARAASKSARRCTAARC
jgi:hypothetical protein